MRSADSRKVKLYPSNCINAHDLDRTFFAVAADSLVVQRREILAMDKKKSDHLLVVDVNIHYQGKVYNFAMGRLLRWLLPLAIVVIRLVAHMRETTS